MRSLTFFIHKSDTAQFEDLIGDVAVKLVSNDTHPEHQKYEVSDSYALFTVGFVIGENRFSVLDVG